MTARCQPMTARPGQTNYDKYIAGKVYSERMVADEDRPLAGHLPYDQRPVQLFTKHWGD